MVDYKECLRFSGILLRLYAPLDHEDWLTALFLSSLFYACTGVAAARMRALSRFVINAF